MVYVVEYDKKDEAYLHNFQSYTFLLFLVSYNW